MFLGSIPFGLLILALLIVLGSRTELRPLGWPGYILLALLLVLGGNMAVFFYRSARMEWAPAIRNDAQVVGAWTDDRETVTLHSDHRFDFHSPNERFSGEWSRVDHNLRLKAEGIDCSMMFVSYASDLHLMPRPPGDPDGWDGKPGLWRVP